MAHNAQITCKDIRLKDNAEHNLTIIRTHINALQIENRNNNTKKINTQIAINNQHSTSNTRKEALLPTPAFEDINYEQLELNKELIQRIKRQLKQKKNV